MAAVAQGSTADLIGDNEATVISSSLESSITKLKLIGILKEGDKTKVEQFFNDNPEILKSRGLLHLAVQIAPTNLINWLLKTYVSAGTLDINSTDKNKNTPLHLASMFGRRDVVLELLKFPDINDTIQNNDLKQPVEVAKYPELAEAMQMCRARYVAKIASEMKTNMETENIAALEELLSHPRASALLDINGQDPDTGSTVLHSFVRKKNRKMVEFILSHGGDPFKRDIEGVLPIELAKDDGIKRLLKTSMKEQNVVILNSSSKVFKKDIDAAKSGTTGSTPSTGSAGSTVSALIGPPPSMKGYLKKWTNFTGGYKLRWFVLENGELSYYKRQDDTEKACRGAVKMRAATVHLDSSEKLKFEVHAKGGQVKFHLRANHPVETNRWVWALSNAIQYEKDLERIKTGHNFNLSEAGGVTSNASYLRPPSRTPSVSSQFINHKANRSISSATDDGHPVVVQKRKNGANSIASQSTRAIDESDQDYEDYAEEDTSEMSKFDIGSQNEMYSTEDAIKVELAAVRDLFAHIKDEEDHLSSEKKAESLEAIDYGLKNLESAIHEFIKAKESREAIMNRKLEDAEVKESLWAKNLQELQIEHEQIQKNLHKALQRRKEVYKVLKRAEASGDAGQRSSLTKNVAEILYPKDGSDAELDEGDTDDDDEFFDVDEEKGSLAPSATAASEETGPTVPTVYENNELEATTDSQKKKKETILSEGTFQGYEDPPRKKLDLNDDDRPKVGLWGILKNLIGKDMTKMSLPVTFNECTSLLQRYCEDFEYPDLLDNACKAVDDPALRSVWVAAFALSSYSSTLFRVAKPFNPLLGETYEYSRPDKGYRCFCEQVSHHPPIGAMIAEHPKWDYYGYSNVKPKFNGRNIDVVPQGRWYLKLRPDKGAGVEEELYSFRKLTSTVVGIITGSPAVDNHGDLIVTNHTLGYVCTVKCKARGWRGSGAFEVKGVAKNAKGVPEWSIGGHWDRRLVAKKVSPHDSHEHTHDDDNEDFSQANGGKERIVLWQVKQRPPSPFSLTEFAISLNALPERLRQYIAPTDTRLRPDQRAMELGQYDLAFKEKARVEDKQRAAKRERDEKNIHYSPKWFTKDMHPVTKEEYYRPTFEYWSKRHEGKLADSGDIF